MTEIRRSDLMREWAGVRFDEASVDGNPMTDSARALVRSADEDGDGVLCEREIDQIFERLDHLDGRQDGVAMLTQRDGRTAAGEAYLQLGLATKQPSSVAPPSSRDAAPSETSFERAREMLREPARCREMLEEHRSRMGVPGGGFRGQVDLEQGGRPRLSWSMARVRSEGSERAMTANLERCDRIFHDRALLLAVTAREHGSAWTARGTEPTDSYGSGGLDHLGGDMPRMRGLVPAAVMRNWHVQDRDVGIENGRAHTIAPATIPARDQMVAYAATLRLREQTFESHVREVFGDRADALLVSMSPDARRAWIQATFGRPGRTEYDAVHERFALSEGEHPHELPSAFGALQRLATEAAQRGEQPDLDAIFTDPMLARYATFQRARTTALEARVIEDSGLAGAP